MKDKKTSIENSIKYWTGLNDAQYRMLIYQTGLDFLAIMEGNEGQYFKVLEGEKAFWKWWVINWLRRDEHFLAKKKDELKHLKPKYIEPKYKTWHNLEYLKEKTPLEADYYRLLHLILE